MARRPLGSIRRSPRLKQGKPRPPGVGRPSPKPKKSTGPAGGPKPKRKPKGMPDRFDRFKPKIDRSPTVKGRAMGGQASRSVSRAEIAKTNRDRRRKEIQEMLERLYGKKKIVPKMKPLKKKDGGDIREKIQRDMIKRNPQDFDLKTGARLTPKDKMDRIRKARDKAKRKPKRKIF